MSSGAAPNGLCVRWQIDIVTPHEYLFVHDQTTFCNYKLSSSTLKTEIWSKLVKLGREKILVTVTQVTNVKCFVISHLTNFLSQLQISQGTQCDHFLH